MVRMLRLVIFGSALALAGCSNDGGNGGGSGSGSGDTASEDAATTGNETSSCKYAGQYANETCNPLCADESGCPEGQNCTFVGTGFGCIIGDQALGLSCNDETTCAGGGCVELEEGKARKCVAFCKDDTDCGAENQCVLEVNYGGTAPILMCAPKPKGCDIFKQDCTEPDTGCYLAGDLGCMEVGTGKLAEACSEPNGCEKGLICISDKCHTPCNPSTGGPNPKCHLTCPNSTGEIEGVTTVAVCSLDDDDPDCDLLNDQCEPGTNCYYTAQGPKCKKTGGSPGTSPCEQSQDCAPGHACWPGGSTCKPVCNPTEGLHSECASQASPCAKLPGTNAGFCDE